MKPAIIFDLGAVLIDWDRRHLYDKMFDGRTAERDYFLDHVCTLEWNAEMDAGRPFAQAVAAKINEYPDYAPYIAAYHARWEEMIAGPIEGTIAIMAALKEAGHEVHALSNWSAETFPIVRPRFDWFGQILLSAEVKTNKPDPQIYRILLKRIDRRAEDCVFIDDSAANILAARNLGFQTIHFHSPARLQTELMALGVGF
jgi:2-haloacid dehalogenase